MNVHLNGLAIVDGLPKYGTALGATDTAGGWRADKARGGCLIDVPTGAIVFAHDVGIRRYAETENTITHWVDVQGRG